nr:nucleolin 1-like [Ipomoea batatas]
MAPLPPTRGLFKVLSVLLLLLLSFLSQVHCYSSTEFSTARRILEVDEDNDNEDHHPAAFKIKKKTTPNSSLSPKNKTKILKPSTSASPKNQTKVLKSGSGFGSPKNQSKVLKTGFGFGSAKNQTKIKLSSSSLSLKNKTKLLKPISESSKISQKNQFKKRNAVQIPANPIAGFGENLQNLKNLPRHLLLHPLPLLARHRARAAKVFLRYVAVHLRLHTAPPNPRLRVVPSDAPDVPCACFLYRHWALNEDDWAGPDHCGLCCWAALLHGGVP